MSIRPTISCLKSITTSTSTPTIRSFSSSSFASTSKLSPLNKTTLARINRLSKGGNSKGKKLKEKDTLTLEEAAKILQVGLLHP